MRRPLVTRAWKGALPPARARIHTLRPQLIVSTLLVSLALGCASSDDPATSPGVQPNADAGAFGSNSSTGVAGGAIGAGVGNGGTGTSVSPATGAASTGGTGLPPNPSPTTGAGGTRGGLIAGSAGIAGTGIPGAIAGGIAAGTGAAGTGGTAPAPTGPATPAGPDDGDPSQPVVAIPGVACGPNPSLFGLTTTNVVIGGRNVHVAYPCNKHKGAPVTFILNLHGTMPEESLKLYQVAYFAANNYVNSHNLITVAPISAGSQWGNDDGGKDEPHLKEVIAWTYDTFKDFDIRAMWIGGHSWGAMYTTTYVCRPELMDKVKGTILMSTNPMMPACSSRISVINTNAENDIAAPLPQGNIPMQHGCGAPMMSMLGNNQQTLWPNCMKGYVHSNYLMLGKAHADYMDDVVVKSIVDLIKSSRL
jgi:hypothetical protein